MMANQIDYYIYKVHYSTHRVHIESVRTKMSLTESGYTEKTRGEVVKDINTLKKVIYSAPPDNSGLKKGQRVITELLDDVYYIKTIPDKTKRDNLDELPTY
jgi:hypothetical protein